MGRPDARELRTVYMEWVLLWCRIDDDDGIGDI